MLFLQQQAKAGGKARLGIHPISREVKRLDPPAVLYAAVLMLQQVQLWPPLAPSSMAWPVFCAMGSIAGVVQSRPCRPGSL